MREQLDLKITEEKLSNWVEKVIMLTARMMRIHIIALTSMFLPLLDLEFLFLFFEILQEKMNLNF